MVQKNIISKTQIPTTSAVTPTLKNMSRYCYESDAYLVIILANDACPYLRSCYVQCYASATF